MNSKILAVLVVFVTNFRLCQGKRYDNFSLYTSTPLENEHLRFFQNLDKQKYIDVVFWKEPSKLYQRIEFVINPKDVDVLLERARHYGMKVEQINTDVQKLFDSQNVVSDYIRFKTDTFNWDKYHNLGDIYQWLSDIAAEYRDICQLLTLGHTAEKRNIHALSIQRQNSKGTVIVEAGLHGHEWISTEFVLYLIDNLVRQPTTNNRLKLVASYHHWILIPVANPDGFEYTHVVDRLWRKNRQFYGRNYGVDLNRNFNCSFGKFGTSNDSGDPLYCGPNPFSELETQAIKKLVSDQADDLRFYFSFHSYGQKIIIPFGDKILHEGNYGEAENLGKQAIRKIYKMYGTKYSIGTTYDTLGHKISGNSASWVKRNFDVPYVYTFLLRDTGTYGYGLPSEAILPTCEETLIGLLQIMTADVKRVRANLFDDLDDSVDMVRVHCYGLTFLSVLVYCLF